MAALKPPRKSGGFFWPGCPSRPLSVDFPVSVTICYQKGAASTLTVPGTLFAPVFPTFAAARRLRVPLADAGTKASVSYTHLRAHETRHDLVCRLLLEKK